MNLPNAQLTEEWMKAALIDARGDLFIAATSLKISPLRLQRLIIASPALEVSYVECCLSTEGDRQALSKRVEAAIAERLSTYRVVGLDSLYELATMPIDENSAQNQVRLAAAARLAGSPEGSTGGGDLAETFKALNEEYHQHAPRIRVTRERLTVETMPQERVIDP